MTTRAQQETGLQEHKCMVHIVPHVMFHNLAAMLMPIGASGHLSAGGTIVMPDSTFGDTFFSISQLDGSSKDANAALSWVLSSITA